MLHNVPGFKQLLLWAIPYQRSEKKCQRQIDDFGRFFLNNFCNFLVFLAWNQNPQKLLFWKVKIEEEKNIFFKEWTNYFKYHIYHSYCMIFFFFVNLICHLQCFRPFLFLQFQCFSRFSICEKLFTLNAKPFSPFQYLN